jgi:hypothetical protein
LQADPGLALLRLRWHRPDVLTGALEAELQWSLLLPARASGSAPRSAANPVSAAPP